MVTVISGLVKATARSHCEVSDYRDALLGRITAFGAAEVALARQAWASLGLRELIEFELKPYSQEGRHVTLKGEELRLSSEAAQSLAMVVHELATNAAKYGALSRPDAKLWVRWRLTRDAAYEARLVVDWLERGGPPVTPPQRRGFGSTVIESCARSLGGAARLDYEPEGLRCTIEMLAARVLVPGARLGEPAY